MTMPFYASPEQLMRDRSEYARKGISRGRSVAVVTYADGVLFVAENPSSTLHKVSEIYDRIGFAAVGRYNEFENLRVGRRPAGRRPRLLLQPPRRHRPGHRQRLRADPRRDLHRADEAVRGGDLRRRGGRHRRERPALPAHLRRLGRRRARLRRHGRPGRGRHRPPARALPRRHGPVRRPRRSASGPCPRSARSPPAPATAARRTLTAAQLEVAVLDRRRPKRAFRRITGSALRTLLGDEADPGRDRRRPGRRRTPRACPSPAPRPGSATRPTPTPPAAPSTTAAATDGRTSDADYRVNKDAVAKARELIDAGEVRRRHRVVRRRAVGRRRERRDREARLRRLRRLAPRDRPRRLRGDQGPLQVPVRRLREGQPGRAHPRQAARRPERPRRDREGRRPSCSQHLDEKRGAAESCR